MSRTRHVYPTRDARPHITDGGACWCNPRPRNFCPECEDGLREPCSLCQGEGLVDAIADSQPDLIVHHQSSTT